MSDDIKPHRDEAFRRVGRNIANFQRLEASLRQLVPNLSLAGTLNDYSALRAAKAKKLKKSSFGDLTGRFHSEVFKDRPTAPEPETHAEIGFSHSIRVESGSVEPPEREKALAQLVRDRNRLVHSDLVNSNLGSISACKALSVWLDEQNERINAELSFIGSLRQAQSETVAALIRFVNSEEFFEKLKSDEDDA
jgi:hypothetical protein